MHPIDCRLRDLGISLPRRTEPAGKYLPVTSAGKLLFVSGQFPIEDGRLKYLGRVGEEVTPEEGYKAARLAALNVLSHLRFASRNWKTFGQLLKVEGHVASAHDFHEHPKVLNGASEIFNEVLGMRAGHARTVFAHTRLPLDSCIELVVTASLK